MNKQVSVIQMPSGKYVKEWQYSQGYFDVVETKNIFEAENFFGQHGQLSFDTFFEKRGAKLIKGEMIFKEI
jgi:hypothetical protein